MRYLSLEEVLYIQNKLIEKYGGSKGIRDMALLESAIVRPRTTVFGEDAYPTLFLKAAAIFHSLIKNHSFIDGNKRTALGAMHLMLLVNYHDLTSSTQEEIEMCLKAATGRMTIEEIAKWIEENSKR